MPIAILAHPKINRKYKQGAKYSFSRLSRTPTIFDSL